MDYEAICAALYGEATRDQRKLISGTLSHHVLKTGRVMRHGPRLYGPGSGAPPAAPAARGSDEDGDERAGR